MSKTIRIILMIILYLTGFIMQLISQFAFGGNYTQTSLLVLFSSALPLSISIFLFGNVVFEKIKALKIFTYVISGWALVAFVILLILTVFFDFSVMPNGAIVIT